MYLLRSADVALGQEWVTGKGIPGGDLFFQGPHEMPLAALKEHFGSNPELIIDAGKRLGGEPAEFGDASIRLQALPRLPMVIAIWQGDDEFPANASILFDKSISSHLPLDVTLDLTNAVVRKLTGVPG